jgi:hypothetical protein
MDELQAAIEQHNARQIKLEIAQHLAAAEHEIELAYGLLDDLTIYLPNGDPA